MYPSKRTKKRILVTGAQGFLGREIVIALGQYDNVKVFPSGRREEKGIIKCDLTNIKQIKLLMEECKPDCIIHCAAYVPKSTKGYESTKESKISFEIFDKLLQASESPIVYISSMTVYGNIANHSVKEEEAKNPRSEYAKGKLKAERHLTLDNRPSIIIRIPGLFGIQRKSGVVYNLLNALKNNCDFELPDNPVVWSAMDVSDAAHGISKIALSKINKRIKMNFGYRGPCSLSKLMKLACNIFNYNYAYEVKHPEFEFDLTYATKLKCIPNTDFKDALIKFSKVI